MSENRPLTEKEAAFVREFQVDHNATQAAIRAGYSPKSAANIASDLKKKPHIAAELAKLETEAIKTGAVAKDEVIQKLRDTYTKAIEGKHYSAAVRAAELLGKTIGVFVDRVDVELTSMNDAALIEEVRKKFGDEAAEKARKRLSGDETGAHSVH